jgi:hypothetical protein
MSLPNPLLRFLPRGAATAEEQALQGQAAIDAYEAGEHGKWGRFLVEKEQDLMGSADAELARQLPMAPAPAEEEIS